MPTELAGVEDSLKKLAGFKQPVVVHTDQWANLDPPNTFAISTGRYETEAEANEALLKIKKFNPRAYVKYTGDSNGEAVLYPTRGL